MKTYGSLCTQFYDLDKTDQRAQREIAFYLNYAREAAGPVLEPMCGTGRILLPLLEAGIPIEGFDASTEMLAALKTKYAAKSQGEPPVWQQYVQDFSSEKRYALIFIPFGSWGLILDPQHRLDGLRALYDHLAPGGKLVMEIDMEASELEPKVNPLDKAHTRADGSIIALRLLSAYDLSSQRYSVQCAYIDFDANMRVRSTERELLEQHLFRPGEMEQVFSEVGFSVVKRYTSYYKTPVINEAKALQIIYECTK